MRRNREYARVGAGEELRKTTQAEELFGRRTWKDGRKRGGAIKGHSSDEPPPGEADRQTEKEGKFGVSCLKRNEVAL